MIIIEDKAQKINKHKQKHDKWNELGVEVRRYPLPVGDYILVNDKIRDVIKRKEDRGVYLKKMDFLGTYDICVDSKFSIGEMESDLCGKQHARFRDECILAKNNGIQLVILIEDDGGYVTRGMNVYNKPCKSVKDVYRWQNPRLYLYKNGVQLFPKATTGDRLARVMHTMTLHYGVQFSFCKKGESAEKIIEILKGEKNE